MFEALNPVSRSAAGCLVIGLIAAMATLISSTPGVQAAKAEREERVALVIGNTAYTALPPLVNPGNDAVDMAKALEGLDFKVIAKTDLKLDEMRATIREFRKTLKRGAVGLFYYSGHGLQVDGINYLLPVDATVEYER